MTPAVAAIVLVAGYLLGSIPCGMIVARTYGHVDLTAVGSGRTGATNVLRTMGKGAAAVVFGGDFLKGVLATLLAFQLSGGDPWAGLLAALAAVAGHTYSPFIGFKGGRGVTTGLGATLVGAPHLMLAALVLGLLLVATTRYVSLGSVVGATVGGLLLVGNAAVTQNPAWAVWGILVGGFIVVAHRDNIRRLIDGTERKLGEPARQR